MERRTFLAGLLGGAGAWWAGSAEAGHGHHHAHDLVDCSHRLLRSLRVASRDHSSFEQGLSIRVAASRRHSHHAPAEIVSLHGHKRGGLPRLRLNDGERHSLRRRIEVSLGELEIVLSREDRSTYGHNLGRLAEHVELFMEVGAARHFLAQWRRDPIWNVLETRAHLESCSACQHAFEILIRGTRVDLVPLRYEEQVTVFAEAYGPAPKKPLRLPASPDAMRSALEGKQLTLRARIDPHGSASVTRIDSPGMSPFVIQRAVEMIEQMPWTPASAAVDTVRVVFRW